MRALILAVVLMTAVCDKAAAISPDEVLDDPALEERARSLGKELRCLVCQNQAIDDSDAPLARDLRKIVREQLIAGSSDQEVKDYLVDRYGDFVLLKPPVKIGTLALWAGPFLILLLGGIMIVKFVRARPKELEEPDMDGHDAQKAAAILGRDDP